MEENEHRMQNQQPKINRVGLVLDKTYFLLFTNESAISKSLTSLGASSYIFIILGDLFYISIGPLVADLFTNYWFSLKVY